MAIEAQGAVCPLPALTGRFTPEDISTRRNGQGGTALSPWFGYLKGPDAQAAQGEWLAASTCDALVGGPTRPWTIREEVA